jgi:CHAT domain-containing protein
LLSSPISDVQRAYHVQELAAMSYARYTSKRQEHDLDQSIIRFTEAIFLPPAWGLCTLDIIKTFHYLTLAIYTRSRDTRQPEDVKRCITYLRYLHGQWHEDPNILPFPVTSVLVYALAIQVELKLGDAVQDIEEMAGLCDELLNTQADISLVSFTEAITTFVETIAARNKESMDSGGTCLPEKVIECLRKANVCLPDSHGLSVVLAQSLCVRYKESYSDDDYKEGMAILDDIVNFRGPGDMPSTHREGASDLATNFTLTRFYIHGKPEQLEQAIYHLRNLLDETFLEGPARLFFIEMLSMFEVFSCLYFGGRVDFDSDPLLSSLVSDSESGRPSFRDLTASLDELKDVKSLSMPPLVKHFRALLVICWHSAHFTMTDIKDALDYCQTLLSSHPASPLCPYFHSALADLLDRAFERTEEIEYLNEAISVLRVNFNTLASLELRLHSQRRLTSCLSTRLLRLGRREDLDEVMQLFPMAAQSERVSLPHQLSISYQWAELARFFGHPSTPTAYERAISFMQSSLTFAPTLDIQHSRLVPAMRHCFQTLPLDYASYHIHIGGVKQAIEAIEGGRGLLWSEMRLFRTSIDQIRVANSHLADRFVAVNNELEKLTLAFSPNDGGDTDPGVMHSFGHLVLRQRNLLDDREKLISQIQVLPGFETFLKPPSFDDLRSASLHGPVIMINHCKWRSDIVILLHNFPPSLIPTSNDFYGRAIKLQDQLLRERKKGLESDTYEDALRSILSELYDLVGRPVIKRLNELNVPEQSRVWWCPTSVFCSLPLHAMGPIQSDIGPPKYFLDLYIPSYTPSLSTLIESRKPGSHDMGKPSILLVAQPDANIPKAFKEMIAVQAVDTQVTTLFSARATPTAVLERLRDHPFVHIVCHGTLESGKPFEASFKLHRGERLQLLNIVQSRLPDAEFAFLSACHTAELTDESIADEVLHLAAAMQFCGFRSVVGTMWAMADTDGRDLARDFYQSVFSYDGRQTTRYHERTAEALRDAVKNLRRKGGMTLERWVNFVHYGA